LEYWLVTKIYNVNDNTKVKVVVVFKNKLKSARGLLVYLAVMAVLCKILNRLDLNFMTCSLENPKQSVKR
jgi:hypothetical protein